MRRTFIAAGLAAAVGLAGGAEAQETRTVEPVVVTATKVPTPPEQIGAAVTVITEDELRTFEYEDVTEALRQVPGLEVQRSGGPGKLTTLRIRGAGSNQVQVLVDGMRVSSPTSGLADLSELSLDAVERIEVIRGPQSTLYGADAIGGVVNIITRKGQGPPRGFVHVEGGSDDTWRERVGVSGSWQRFSYSLSGSRLDRGGRFDNDDTEQTAVAGRLGYDFPWGGELSFTGRYSRILTDLPVDSTIPPPTVLDPNAQQQVETWLYTLAYRQPVREWWDVSARFGQWSNHTGFQDSPPPPGDFVTDSLIKTRRREVELLNAFHPARWTTLTVGSEYRVETGEIRGGFDETIETVGLFLQDELRLFDRLFVTGSVRWEDNSVFGDEVTPRVAAALAVKETGTRLRASWGLGFRAPTFNDLFFPGFGNPALEPEHSESYDVGVDQQLWRNRVRLGLTFFHNRFEDLIQIEFRNGQFLPFNVGRARTQGVETSLEVEPLDWLLLYVNYTNTSTRDLITGQPLRRFPEHVWNAGLTVRPLPVLELFAQAHVASSHLEAPGVRNPGWHRIDVGGRWRLLGRRGVLEGLHLTARVENVTDESYEEVFGFRAPGFNALVGLRAEFQ